MQLPRAGLSGARLRLAGEHDVGRLFRRRELRAFVSGPAPYPSSERVKLSTRTRVMVCLPTQRRVRRRFDSVRPESAPDPQIERTGVEDETSGVKRSLVFGNVGVDENEVIEAFAEPVRDTGDHHPAVTVPAQRDRSPDIRWRFEPQFEEPEIQPSPELEPGVVNGPTPSRAVLSLHGV